MDIDDILRDVDPTFDAIPQEKRDLQELTRAWIAERSAPELLPYAAPCPTHTSPPPSTRD
jgi:GINS complex subunit 4